MPRFRYVALAGDGETVKGSIDAGTAVGVQAALEERELQVVSVEEHRSILQLEISRKKVPLQEIMHFSRQLAAFTRAGIPILQALQTFSRESGNKTFKRALDEISDVLRRGDPLSLAVAAHGHSFPRFYVDMLKAAELTGRLDAVLDQLALYMERDLEARRRIRSALAYPGIIGMMSLATVGILTVFVLPRFQVFFNSLNARLPLPTRIVLSAAGFLGHWWWAIGAGAAVVGGSVFSFLRTGAGRRTRDALLLRLPAVGSVVRYSIIERFCRILSSMVGAGVPLPEAMVVVSESTTNAVYERALARVREEMLEGEGIAGPIARTDLFPGAVTQMIRVGEDTGTLDQQLATAASYYEKELDYKIKKLTTYFEPAVIIFMGLVVGFVAIALISAMYGIFRQSGNLQ